VVQKFIKLNLLLELIFYRRKSTRSCES